MPARQPDCGLIVGTTNSITEETDTISGRGMSEVRTFKGTIKGTETSGKDKPYIGLSYKKYDVR